MILISFFLKCILKELQRISTFTNFQTSQSFPQHRTVAKKYIERKSFVFYEKYS